MAMKEVNITNRKAKYEYHFIDTYEAGLQLFGTEIKSIRAGEVQMADAFCYFKKNELYVKNLHIAEYSFANQFNHEPMRERKLLLHRRELKKIMKKVTEKGVSIIPYKLYVNDRGFAKLQIHVATGKKTHDKRDSIKDRDVQRDIQRYEKYL